MRAGRGGREGGAGEHHSPCSRHPQKRNDFSVALPYIPLNFHMIIQAPAPSPEPPGYLGKESVDTADHPPNTPTTTVDPGTDCGLRELDPDHVRSWGII